MDKKTTWDAQPNVYGVNWRPSSDSIVLRVYARPPSGTQRPVELSLDRKHALELAHRLILTAEQFAPDLDALAASEQREK